MDQYKSKLFPIIILIIIIASGLLIYFYKSQSEEKISNNGLFTYIGKLNDDELDKTAISGYKVNINTDLLKDDTVIRLNLPGGITYNVKKDRTEPPSLVDTFSYPGRTIIVDEFYWYGKTIEIGGKVFLGDVWFHINKGKYLTGQIRGVPGFNKYHYTVNTRKDSAYNLQKIDPAKFLPD